MRYQYLVGLDLLLLSTISLGCAAYRAPQPSYSLGFHAPNISCIEIEHRVSVLVNEYACPTPPQQVTNVTAHYTTNGHAILPDPKVTPGKARTTDKNDPVVCGGKSTKTVRKPGIQSVYKAYGAVKKPGVCCEIDHLISLELGGANDPLNEWPQPYEPKPGAHEKDQVENWLHAQVCSGKMALIDAQKQISEDWYKVYLQMPKH